MITFDGPNKLITLESGTTSLTVSELYSRWKDWVATSDNAKYVPAFRQVGGDPLGGGIQAAINTFLRNDLGWRIRPPEEDIVIAIAGNLYAENPALPTFIPTIGGYDTMVRLDLSSNLLQVGGSYPSAAEIATEVWDLGNGIEVALTPRQAMRLIAAANAGKLSGADSSTIVIRDVTDNKDRITATVDADGNRTAITIDAD